MSSEHVRISAIERVYGEKSLLLTQLNYLNSLKRLREYKRLRKEEFALKIALKSKIGEASAILKELEKNLPKVKLYKDDEEKENSHSMKKEEKEHFSLEKELEKIKDKLSKIQ